MVRFTIRDMLWLMVVVGMGVGWWVYVRTYHAEAELRAEQMSLLENDVKLWRFRAEHLAERVEKDGYEVSWAGTLDYHFFLVVPPMPGGPERQSR